jgi:thiamine-phosphate pyrophosphorylase
MQETDVQPCRLCLITPRLATADAFAPRLDEALAAGDVASLIITSDGSDPAAFQRKAELLVPVAQKHGVAALIQNDTRIAARTRADGVHVDSGLADLRTAIEALRPDRVVGAGDLKSRHDAMAAGEADPDYVFFGRLDGDFADEVAERALALAEWWAELFQIPAVLMAGRTIASVAEARATGVDFVALRSAVWDHDEGPGAAVAAANLILASREPVS